MIFKQFQQPAVPVLTNGQVFLATKRLMKWHLNVYLLADVASCLARQCSDNDKDTDENYDVFNTKEWLEDVCKCPLGWVQHEV